MRKKINLVYLVSHPIQYQAPLLKQLAAQEDINLLVLFRSDYSLYQYTDAGFGKTIQWDIPLVEGYAYQVLPSLGGNKIFNFLKPFNYGLKKALRAHSADVLWIHGYASLFDLYAIHLAKKLGIKVIVRGESTLFAMQQGFLRKYLRRLFFNLLD